MLRLKTFRLRQHKKKVLRFNKYSQQNCLNCGYPLGKFDRFCARCGQKNSKKKLNLIDLINEFLTTLFAYDSRVQRTFKAILTSPGKIAKEYIAGKRMKYVNPFRFFIFIAVVFFLLISWLLPYEDMYKDNSVKDSEKEQVITKPNDAEDDESSIDIFQNKKEDTLIVKPSNDNTYNYFKENGYKTFEEAKEETKIKDEFSDWVVYKFLLSLSMIEKQPADFIRFLLPKLPFFIFFFMPIFTLFSKLFYMRRSFNYTEHLVFNFYQQSVFFMLFFIDSMIYKFIDFDASLFFLVIFSIYHIAASKRFYAQGYFKTITKFVFLATLYVFLFLMIVGTFTVLSIAFYK